MVVLLTGCSHTGKTALAQQLLERYHWPYCSIDHLKMGLIRSGNTSLTPEDDAELTAYLWPIVREMVKTVIENGQNLVVEGCYIPFDWRSDFDSRYLEQIRYCCLVMTERYIRTHWGEIQRWANAVERRLDDTDLNQEALIAENRANLASCRQFQCPCCLIDQSYQIDIEPYLK
ncbi:MAG: adenylate kinase [Candidatus Onthomonas sp.]